MAHNMKYKYAVLQNDTYDCESECIYLFEDYTEACNWIQEAWQYRYNEMLSEQLPWNNLEVDEEGCWHEDEYAQICYYDKADEDCENQLYKKYWKLIATSEPLKFGSQ